MASEKGGKDKRAVTMDKLIALCKNEDYFPTAPKSIGALQILGITVLWESSS